MGTQMASWPRQTATGGQRSKEAPAAGVPDVLQVEPPTFRKQKALAPFRG